MTRPVLSELPPPATAAAHHSLSLGSLGSNLKDKLEWKKPSLASWPFLAGGLTLAFAALDLVPLGDREGDLLLPHPR